jgi:hypothetical protein
MSDDTAQLTTGIDTYRIVTRRARTEGIVRSMGVGEISSAAPRSTMLVKILLTAWVAVGCSSASESPAGPPPDWEGLIGNGVTSTEARAEREMGFDLLVPSLLGEPARIVITAPESAPPKFRLTGFVYDSPSHGRFWVIEAVSQTTQGELESLTSCDPAAGCEGSWTIVGLPRGIRGLLIEGPVATSVVWLESDRRFDVIGPSETFDGSFATQVASDVISSER